MIYLSIEYKIESYTVKTNNGFNRKCFNNIDVTKDA
jgi:hypothetical protein